MLSFIDFDILLVLVIVIIVGVVVIDIRLLAKRFRRKSDQPAPESSPRPPASEVNKSKLSRLAGKAKRFVIHRRYVLLHIFAPILVITIAISMVTPIPEIAYGRSYPQQESNWNDYSRPIEVIFNMPVSISTLKPFLSREELKGEWVYDRYLGLPLTRRARFYPEVTLLPDQRLVVYMTGVKRPFVEEGHEHSFNFYTHKPPEVERIFPLYDSQEVDTGTFIDVEYRSDLTESTAWTYQFTPAVTFNETKINGRTIRLTPIEPLAQSETYKLEIFRTSRVYNLKTNEIIDQDNPELVHELSFRTVKAPLVSKFTPSGTGVRENAEIQMKFEVAMDRQMVESSLNITPVFEYSLQWDDDKTLRILPAQPLTKETEYVFTLPAGLRSKTGGVSEREIRYAFTTIGAVKVSTFSPANGIVRVPRNSTISVTFDQEIDQASAQSLFSVSPAVNGTFSWNGNTLTLTPSSPLNFDTTYTIRLQPGIKTVYGLDSKETFTSAFTTVSNVTLLPGFSAASFDHQDYNFTCGVAAFKMLLTRRGFSTNEDSLIALMGHDTSSFVYNPSGLSSWGNPNRAFLGYGNGSGNPTARSAYGVHWDPIIRVANQTYGIQTRLYRGWNVQGLAGEIAAGHPVQIWWWNGVSNYYGASGSSLVYWTDNQTGQTVEALQGMHSVLVVGFYGDASNPTSFIVLDPWWGYNVYSIEKFNNQWPKLGNTGVAFY